MNSLKAGSSNTQFLEQPRTTPHLDYCTVSLPWRGSTHARQVWQRFVAHPTLIVSENKPIGRGGVDKYPHSFTARAGCVQGGYEERVPDKKRRGFNPSPEKEIRFFARFSGKYFDLMDLDQQYEFLCQARAAGLDVTRLDLSLDIDPSVCPFSMDDINNAWEEDNFTGFSRKDRVSSGKRFSPVDSTYYFGSRLSAKLLRIYMHNDLPRIELECKGAVARKVYTALTDFDTSIANRADRINAFAKSITQYVLGATTFKSRSRWVSDASGGYPVLRAANRSEILPWWQAVIDLCKVDPVKIVGISAGLPSYSRCMGWIERQVAKSLWFLSKFHAHTNMADIWEYLKELADKKGKEATKKDHQKLKAWMSEQSMNDFPAFSV